MENGRRKILEWLIEGIDTSRKRDLFDKEHAKEITLDAGLDPIEIIKMQNTPYKGRMLIRREHLTTIYFYPLAIQEYLDNDDE